MTMDFTRHGIILFTADYERCVEFYTGTLGLPVMYAKDQPGSHLTCCAFGDAYLMIEVGGPPPAASMSRMWKLPQRNCGPRASRWR